MLDGGGTGGGRADAGRELAVEDHGDQVGVVIQVTKLGFAKNSELANRQAPLGRLARGDHLLTPLARAAT